MPKRSSIAAAIAKGLGFLEHRQEQDGSFISYSSASMRPFRRLRSWQTVFVPALMLGSLTGLEEGPARAIRERLATFLLSQQDGDGAFNYWAKQAPEYETMAYPADLDDTFCTLAALHLHNPSLVDEAKLVQAVRLLLATETAVGGPYRTWVVAANSEAAWLDIDLAVNTNIAFFLSLIGSRLPALDKMMGKAITADTLSSPYYPSPYALLYYLARAYQGPEQSRLLALVHRYQAKAGTDLDQALCVIARLRLGDTAVDNAVQQLLQDQRRDGSWAAAAFYADPVKRGKQYYNGGPELTTAFVLEALQAYIVTQKATAAESVPYSTDSRSVLATARRHISKLDAALKPSISRSLGSLARSNEGAEITGLPQLFYRSLTRPGELPRTFLRELGAANLYGWLAYTIYDDFLDDEGRPALLPAANAALRRSFQGYAQALPDADYHAAITDTFDAIDAANAWEVAQCRCPVSGNRIRLGRLPNYGRLEKLAERSLGHILGPLAILYAVRADAKAIEHCRQGLQSYLIARQLNDDLHDWQDDLKKGHLSYVVSTLLTQATVTPGSYEVVELIDRLKPLFWRKVLPAICRDMERLLATARKNLQTSGLSITNAQGIGILLHKQEQTIHETLARQQQAQSFLNHYNEDSHAANT